MPTLTKEDVLVCPRLPSLPSVAIDVLELTRDKNVQLSEIARVVQNDQALCTKILRTVNSSYYGLSKPCPTITRALAYLGLSTVKSLVLGFSLVDITKTDGSFDMVDYWRRGMFSATAARRIAGLHGMCDTEEAFVGALMQDVGMIAINAAASEEYAEMIQRTEGDHRKLVHLEREAFGFDHAEIGATVGKESWKLPAQLVDAIRHHHDGEAIDHRDIVLTVALAERAAASVCVEDSSSTLEVFNRRGAEWFKLKPAELNQLLMQITEDASQLASLFKISTGAPPDVLSILSEAQEASIEHQIEIQHETDRLRQTNDELARKATTDALTNIANRSRFDQELLSRFDQAHSFKGCLGIVLTDLDRFKNVNDVHGHQVGDAVLVEIAARLAGCLRGSDMVCRYGGEEFVVVLPGATRRDAAMVAERLRAAVENEPIDLDGVPNAQAAIPVTASFGVAVYEPETRDIFSSPEMIVAAADKALYAAKEAGRNCVRVFRARRAA